MPIIWDFQKEIREISVRSWPGLTALALGQRWNAFWSSFPALFSISPLKKYFQTAVMCFFPVFPLEAVGKLSVHSAESQTLEQSTGAACHPFWLRLSKRRWITRSPMRLPAAGVLWDVGSMLLSLGSEKMFVYVRYHQKSHPGEQLWCLWLGDVYDQQNLLG